MAGRKQIIFHVEDDLRVAGAVGTLLRDAGYHVVTVHTAEEGMRRVGKVRPDLVILDIGMPGMSGLTVLRQVTQAEPKDRVPVLIYTAVPGMVDDEARRSAQGMLTKPSESAVLLGAVSRILADAEAPRSEAEGS